MDQERASKVLGWLINELNLPATASADDVIAHVKIIGESLKSAQAAMGQIHAALGLPADADADALVGAAQSRAGSPDPARFVPMAEFQRVSCALHTLQSSQREAAAAQAVSAAMSAGKVAPGMKAWASDYAARDMDGFSRYVDSAPVIVAAHAALNDQPPVAAANPLLADAKKRASAKK